MQLRIILADDHPVLRLGAKALIEGAGHHVVAEAGDPDELFAALSSTPCDVLVTDFSMPGEGTIDGPRMIQRVRRLYPDLPIVLLTMMNNSATVNMLVAYGLSAMVEKGASMAELPIAIQAAAKGRLHISEAMQRKLQENMALSRETVRLSPKEAEVIRLLASGLKVSQIAVRLHKSITTISRQKGDAMRKLGIDNDVDLLNYARDNGLIS